MSGEKEGMKESRPVGPCSSRPALPDPALRSHSHRAIMEGWEKMKQTHKINIEKKKSWSFSVF